MARSLVTIFCEAGQGEAAITVDYSRERRMNSPKQDSDTPLTNLMTRLGKKDKKIMDRALAGEMPRKRDFFF
jgi:hypothetical protein